VRRLYALLLLRENEPVALILLQHGGDRPLVLGRMSVVSPSCRGLGLGRYLLRVREQAGLALGADLVYGLAELDNFPQCTHLEKEGHELCGVIPDSEVRRIGGALKYVPEGIYVKLLIGKEELASPDAAQLSPRTAALFCLLHGDKTPALSSAPVEPATQHPAPDSVPDESEDSEAAATWPDVAQLGRRLGLPAGVTVRAASRADAPWLTSLPPAFFPELPYGAPASLGSLRFYEEHVALHGEAQSLTERPCQVFLFEQDAQPILLCVLSYEAWSGTLRCEYGAVAAAHKRRGLATLALRLVRLIGDAVAASAIQVFATLRHPAVQRACERAGFHLWGVLPAFERYEAAAGGVKRGSQALYGISRIPPARSHWPAAASLPAHRARIAAFLRGL
jgi:GNAT superfamily N-acetyltransferase